jgi:hypothetical protein
MRSMWFCHSPSPYGCRVGKVADVELGRGKPRNLSLLPFGKEPFGDSALIENLDGACVQSAGTRAGKILAGAPLNDGNVDLRQREFARQHQPRRAASGDHHRMFGHRNSSFTMSAKFEPARGLAASLGVRDNVLHPHRSPPLCCDGHESPCYSLLTRFLQLRRASLITASCRQARRALRHSSCAGGEAWSANR